MFFLLRNDDVILNLALHIQRKNQLFSAVFYWAFYSFSLICKTAGEERAGIFTKSFCSSTITLCPVKALYIPAMHTNAFAVARERKKNSRPIFWIPIPRMSGPRQAPTAFTKIMDVVAESICVSLTWSFI